MAALEKQAKTKAKEQTRVNELRASLAAKGRERNSMEARLNDTRTLDELKEQEAELQRQNEAVIRQLSTMQTHHLLINKPPKEELRKDKRSLLVCKRRLMKEKERFHFVRG